jgi:hypothetical protein
MRLSLWLPEAEAKEIPAVMNLARTAPVFRQTVNDAGERGYVAAFSDMVESLDTVVLLIEQAVKLRGVRITVNDRPVARPTLFWSGLLCYWESLAEADPGAYCLRRSARLGDVSGCPNQTCLSHCQFICTRCLGVVHELGSPPVGSQLLSIARQAEVDWCPNLKLPS